MATTTELTKLCKRAKNFCGVFSANELPSYSKSNQTYIINLDESFKDGSHWVALYVDKNRFVHYFDSFGRPPQSYILTFIEKINGNYYHYNKIKYQGNSSIACGYFCVVFVFMSKNLKKFYSIFEKCKHLKNEMKLQLMIKRLLKTFVMPKGI